MRMDNSCIAGITVDEANRGAVRYAKAAAVMNRIGTTTRSCSFCVKEESRMSGKVKSLHGV